MFWLSLPVTGVQLRTVLMQISRALMELKKINQLQMHLSKVQLNFFFGGNPRALGLILAHK